MHSSLGQNDIPFCTIFFPFCTILLQNKTRTKRVRIEKRATGMELEENASEYNFNDFKCLQNTISKSDCCCRIQFQNVTAAAEDNFNHFKKCAEYNFKTFLQQKTIQKVCRMQFQFYSPVSPVPVQTVWYQNVLLLTFLHCFIFYGTRMQNAT